MAAEPVGLKVLSAIVALMPGEAREEYGREILLVCRRRMEEAGPGDGRAGIRFWLAEWGAGLRAAAASWRDHLAGSVSRAGASLFFEARTAARGLRRRPLFFVATVLILGFGIGANAGVSGVGWSVLAAPLPFPGADRLVRVFHNDDLSFGVSLNELETYRRSAHTLDDIAGWTVGGATLVRRGRASRVVRARVTPNLFRVLGRGPQLGRGFDPDGRNGGVVLSHHFWRSAFGADPAVVGRTIRLDRVPRTVVGVLPAEVAFPDADVDLHVPVDRSEPTEPGRVGPFLDAVARLAPGIDLHAARAEVRTLARRMKENDPGAYEAEVGFAGHLVPFREVLVRRDRPVLVSIVAAAALLFVAACFNVATLVAARSEEREGELVIRRALGAGRGRIVGLPLVEAVLMALCAAGVAGPVALAVARVVPAFLPASSIVTGLDPETVAVLAAPPLAGVSAVLIGLFTLPRLSDHGARPGASRGITGSTGRLTPGLPALQVALAVVLVSGGALLFRTVRELSSADLGYDVEGVLSARVSLPGGAYDSYDERRAFFRRLQDRLAGDPAVREVALVNALPLSAYGGSGDVTVEAVDPDSAVDVVSQRVAGVGFFGAMGIPLVAGRGFGTHDRPESPPVAVVDERFARRFFDGPRRALGKRIRFFFGGEGWSEIVGVVGHVRQRGPGVSSGPQVYVPFAQRPTAGVHVVVRYEEDRLAPAVSALRRAVGELDPGIPVYDLASMDERLRGAIQRERFAQVVFLGFGILALLLAGVGTYGVLTLVQRRRSREIGIRRTLGAPPAAIVRSVAGSGVLAVAAGLAGGALGALVLARVLESLLHTVDGGSLWSLGWALAAVSLTGLLAIFVPVLRALRVDPALTLEAE